MRAPLTIQRDCVEQYLLALAALCAETARAALAAVVRAILRVVPRTLAELLRAQRLGA
jgi:hypothetical protein